jgi:hypothetical protein
MTAELFILPLHYNGPTLTLDDLFRLTFWVLTLPMFVAMMGVFLSRRIDPNIKVSNSVKLMLPLLFAGFIWTVTFSSLDTVFAVVDFISSLVYEDYIVYVGNHIAIFIFSVPAILGFLRASFSYPDRDRLYGVAFVIVLVASWALMFTWYEQTTGFDWGIIYIAATSSVLFIGIMVLAASPVAYFLFLAHIYRTSSDSEPVGSFLIPCLLVTVIYSPLFLLSFLMMVA